MNYWIAGASPLGEQHSHLGGANLHQMHQKRASETTVAISYRIGRKLGRDEHGIIQRGMVY
jgi:hypothetical protein